MSPAQLQTVGDRELMLRIADGDVRAFETIYDRYSAPVYSLAARVTGRRRAAEEATQEVFLSLWRTARSYDPERGTVRTWLLSVVRNRSIDWLRRERRHDREVEIDDAIVGQLEAAERTEEVVAAREDSLHARQLLDSLPTEQRQVIELTYFKGLTQAEIAEQVGVPLGTVKGRQRLALAKLHHKLTPVPRLAALR
jgi:RNA polymerase sigma-70 factor (ECF subfamily)